MSATSERSEPRSREHAEDSVSATSERSEPQPGAPGALGALGAPGASTTSEQSEPIVAFEDVRLSFAGVKAIDG
ncbi:MAG: hypothetical protein QOE61_2400, partial [Micromonosporaceae bacterium]|nr:hypothetical protein [Micromonosporaceae bacterium]